MARKVGNRASNLIKGTSSADVILGYAGNDTLYGYGGDDVLSGGVGADKLYGGVGNDSLYGGSGDDALYGGAGKDLLSGGDGADVLVGGAGADRMYGGEGRDTFYAGAGDKVFGGLDVDTVVLSVNYDEASIVRTATGYLVSAGASTLEVTGVERFRFADGTFKTLAQFLADQTAQTFTLTEDQDDIAGTSGNDTIKGTDLTLTVFDNIDGGAGTDTIRLTFTNTVNAIAGGVEVANVENVIINAAGEDTTADISGWTGVQNVTVNAPAGSVGLTSAATGAVTVDANLNATVTDEAAATVTVTAGGAAIVTAGDANITVDAGADVAVTAADAGAVVVTVDGEGADVAVTADSADSVSVDGSDAVTITVDDLGAVTLASAVVLDAEDAPSDYTQVVAGITTVANTALDLTLNGADVKLTVTDSNAAESATDDDLTTLNLTVAASALDNSLILVNGEGTAVTDINIDGAGNLELVLAGEISVTDINAGALTGDISVSIAGATTNYAGGSGVDTITLTSLPVADAEDDTIFATVIDGGAGDADVVELDATLAAGAADIVDGAKLTTAITGFEKLSLTAFADDDVEATLFGIDYVVVAGTDASSQGSVTIASEGTVELTTALADIALVVDGAVDGDAADFSLNVVLTGDGAGIAAGGVTVADVGAIALASNGTANENGDVAAENSVELAAASATTLTVTGNAALDLTGEGVVFTALETVAAGDFDAGLTIDVFSSMAEDGVTITTGDGDDVITGSINDDTIVSGDGNDVVMGGAGADTITVGASDKGQQIVYGAASESSGLNIDTVIGFNANDLDADAEATAYNTFQFDVETILSATFTTEKTTGEFLIDFLGNFNTITAANTALQTQSDEEDADTTLQFVYVTNDNSIYGDANGNGVIDEGDIGIELTGLVGTLSDNNFGSDYFAFA